MQHVFFILGWRESSGLWSDPCFCSNLIDVGLFTVDPELWMNLACKDQ